MNTFDAWVEDKNGAVGLISITPIDPDHDPEEILGDIVAGCLEVEERD